MRTQTYPSERVVVMEYDGAGRMAGIKDQARGSFYAGAVASDETNRIQYSAHGAVSQMRFGNRLWEHTNFNSRLQMIRIGLGTAATNSSVLQLDYGYGTTANNGNLLSHSIASPGPTLNQSYTYDALNRLETGSENAGTSWKQKFPQKERDPETGLDYFGARYYSSRQGRFLSPDAPFMDQFTQNPQSWNLYSYTRNNPVRISDKDGRITPWDILDIISLIMSVKDFWNQPSLANAGWIAADAIGAILPLVPLGSIRRGSQIIGALKHSASIKNLMNASELAAFSRLSQEGLVLATGEDNVREAVGMTKKFLGKEPESNLVADLITLTPGNKFIITEVKEVENIATGTADTAHALAQLKNTANHLVNHVSGAQISKFEFVVKAGTNLGPNFKVLPGSDQLFKFNDVTKRFEPVRIMGKVVHVVETLPPPVPSSLRYNQ